MNNLIISIIRELRKQGYDQCSYHIDFNVELTTEIYNLLMDIRDSKSIDFNIPINLSLNDIGNIINIDFNILPSSKLKIYGNLDDFLLSKTSISSNLLLIHDFYIYDIDCYYSDLSSSDHALNKIKDILTFSKFISLILCKDDSNEYLNKRFYMKDKSFNINFSIDSFEYINNVNLDFVNNFMEMSSDPYKVEKEVIIMNSIYYSLDKNDNDIDDIICFWKDIFNLYNKKLIELIDNYYINEREVKIYKVRLDSIKVCNDIISDMILKSLSIPLLLGCVITVDENLSNNFTIIILFGGIFTYIVTWMLVSEQEEIKNKIIDNYDELFNDNSFDNKDILSLIIKSRNEIKIRVDRLNNVILLIKLGLISSLIIIVSIILGIFYRTIFI